MSLNTATIGGACLVMVVGGLSPDSKDLSKARALVSEGLASTLGYGRQMGVKIAIEPLHPMYAGDRACINTLGQALDICDQLGDVVIDIPRLRSLVEAEGFDGYNEVEIFSSQNWWTRDPDEVLSVIVHRGETVV